MAILVNVGAGEGERRDYPSLYARLCDCAGPQPSFTNPRLDEHSRKCPYRREVEGDAGGPGEEVK